MNSTVIYVGPFSFPSGGAAARRILGNSMSLLDYGFEVIIGTGQLKPEGFNDSILYKGLRIDYIGERTADNFPSLIKFILYLNIGRKTLRWLDKFEKPPKAIILYSGYSPYLLRLIPWCKKNKIPLIFDAVEWYDAPNCISKIFNPYYWNIELAMRKLLPKVKNLIVISKYLESYYQNKTRNIIRIPPTIDLKQIEFEPDPIKNEKLVLIYAGSPDIGKDSFDNILKAILTIDSRGVNILFKVAGMTKQDILSFNVFRNARKKELPPVIKSLGILTHKKTIEEISKADFSLLQRPKKRNVQAGFPTKVVESLSVGTPVITNMSSDLGDYIKDGKEAIICKGFTAESLILAIRKAMQISFEDRITMRSNARNLAIRSFDYSNFTIPLGEFIENAI